MNLIVSEAFAFLDTSQPSSFAFLLIQAAILFFVASENLDRSRYALATATCLQSGHSVLPRRFPFGVDYLFLKSPELLCNSKWQSLLHHKHLTTTFVFESWRIIHALDLLEAGTCISSYDSVSTQHFTVLHGIVMYVLFLFSIFRFPRSSQLLFRHPILPENFYLDRKMLNS